MGLMIVATQSMLVFVYYNVSTPHCTIHSAVRAWSKGGCAVYLLFQFVDHTVFALDDDGVTSPAVGGGGSVSDRIMSTITCYLSSHLDHSICIPMQLCTWPVQVCWHGA